MPQRLPPLAVTLVAALALCACGGGRPYTVQGGRFTVVLDDFSITPQAIDASSGRLTVTVVNQGRIGHGFRLRAGTREVLKISTLKPGRRVSRSFRLRPGHYRMFCAIANHEELGMWGTLVVR